MSRISAPIRGAIVSWRNHLTQLRGQAREALDAAQKKLESIEESLAVIDQAERDLESELGRAAQQDYLAGYESQRASISATANLYANNNIHFQPLSPAVGEMLPLDKKKEDA